MLVLQRRLHQSLLLETADGPVTIYVSELRDRVVRLGIEAPRSVRVVRPEAPDRAPPARKGGAA